MSPNLARPENGAEALARAQKLEVDGIETDLRLSQDFVPILCHDRNIQRLTGLNRLIEDCHASELVGLGFLTLKQALAQFNQQLLVLEMKDHEADAPAKRRRLVEQTVAVMQASGRSDPLLSFSDFLLRHAAEIAPHLQLGRNMDVAELHPYDFLSCNIEGLNADFVAAAHEAGQPVITWTVNDVTGLNHALQCGVDGIISDHPLWLQHELGRR